MPVTATDIAVLQTLARYYVLTREQIGRLCFPDHHSGRSLRKRLSKLRRAGYIARHRMSVVLPESHGAAPVYAPRQAGVELLASYFDDETYLATNTRTPRADRLAHWIAVNETRMTIEEAIAAQETVHLIGWVGEWETVDKDAASEEQFCLHTQLSQNPPLSCSPDAAFQLEVAGHRKVFYLERDLGTASPKQIAARKTKGYAELARRQYHRRHFPETTNDSFRVLFITTSAYRCRETAKQIGKRAAPELWLFLDQKN